MKLINSTDGKYYEGWFYFHNRTDKAILVSDTGDQKDAIWLPLSQCIGGATPVLIGERSEVELCIPEWLAKEKDLI